MSTWRGTISRKDFGNFLEESSETIRWTSYQYVIPRKIESELYGDMQTSTEMFDAHSKECCNMPERNSLSGGRQKPRTSRARRSGAWQACPNDEQSSALRNFLILISGLTVETRDASDES